MYLENLIAGVEGTPSFDYYVKRDFNKMSGRTKRRIIWRPNESAREIQNLLLDDLRSLDYGMPCATGSRKGCSYVENALAHRRSRFFYLLDLESAFPTITPEMATSVLCKINSKLTGKETEVCAFLSRYCFLSPEMIEACRNQGVRIEPSGLMAKEIGGLITGGPVAPYLFDLILAEMVDKPIEKLLFDYFNGKRGDWLYTRYIDDLTFSFPSHQIGRNPDLRKQIRLIIQDAGFGISHHKAKLLDIRKGAIQITGVNLVLGRKGVHCKLSKTYLEGLRHFFFIAAKPDSDITLSQVSGVWGAFYACLRRRHVPLSALEHEIIGSYNLCRARLCKDKKSPKDPDPDWLAQLRKKLQKQNRRGQNLA